MKKYKLLQTAFFALIASATMISCSKKSDSGVTPVANKISPDSSSGGNVLTLTGSGLAAMKSIVFDNGNVPATFNPVFNTDEALVFRVPDTANGGPQKIIFTNINGKSVSVNFKVIALVTISDVSNYNFTAGTQITITGNNLGDVSSVVLAGTTTAVTVVSKSKKTLVIAMPVTTLDRTKLDITNASGKITTTQEFINYDKAFRIFTDGYAPGFQDAAWGDAGFISTTVAKSGTSSYGKKFAAGQWHQFGFGYTNIDNAANYQYLTFWIKGASVDYPLWISTATSAGGFASFNDYDKINVPANVWTYFKLPLSQLKLWSTGTAFNQIGWRIQGPNGQDETFYLDDVMLVK